MAVDFSPAALSAAAGVDPWALAQRLVEADPAAVEGMALRFRRAGAGAADAARAGEVADRVVAAGFHNDGRAVFDAPASSARGATLLANRGEKMEETARALLVVGAELAAAMSRCTARLDALREELARVAAAHAVAVSSITGVDPAAVAAAVDTADRWYQRAAVDAVRASGRSIQALLDQYNQVLISRADRLESLGYGVVLASAGGTEGQPEDAQDGDGLLGGAPDVIDDTLAAGVGYASAADRAVDRVEDAIDGAIGDAMNGAADTVGGPIGDVLHWAADTSGELKQQTDRAIGRAGAQIANALGGATGDAYWDAIREIVAPPISPEGRAAVEDYIGPGHQKINQSLRGEIPSTPRVEARADAVSRGLAELPPVRETVYRGTQLTEEQLARYQPGEPVTESAFTSSSLNEDRVFSGNVKFIIESENGKYIAPFAPRSFAAQQEVLFDRGTTFEVVSRDIDAGTGRIVIRMLEEAP